MPTPPDFESFTDIKFITNYFLNGCAPPWEIIVEFSQAPAADVAVLFVGFDPETWFQEIFDPGKGRRRRPSRKGRKRLGLPGFPDWNEYGGKRIRNAIGPFPGLALPGFRYLFRIWGGIELVNFTVAVVDGFSNVGFETLWGLFQVQPETCKSFGRIARQWDGWLTFGGAGPPIWPINLPIRLYSFGYNSVTGFSALSPDQPNTAAFTATIFNPSGNPLRGALCLYTGDGEILAESSRVDLNEGDSTERTVSVDLDGAVNIRWGWKQEAGNGQMLNPAFMGFTNIGGPL